MLSLVNNLSPISFCDKQCSNVNNDEFKSKILSLIDEKFNIDVIGNAYKVIKPNYLKNVLYHQHVLATLTCGAPYLLFLTKIDNVNCCFFIDRKLKDGYSYPKIHCVKYRFHDSLFSDTIITGELIRDSQRNWFFMLTNLLIYKGESMQSKNIISKFELLNDILLNQYTPDPDIDQCPLFIKKLFMYKDFNYVTQEFIPSLSYNCKGLVFYNLNGKYSDYIYIIPRDERIVCKSQDIVEQEIKESHPHLMMKNNSAPILLNSNVSNNLNSNSNNNSNSISNSISNRSSNNTESLNINNVKTKKNINKDNVVLKVMKTDTSDIYHLYFLNSSNELTKYNYALIPNIKTSKYLFNLFNNIESNENNGNSEASQNSKLGIAMECSFSEKFKKWIPLNLTNVEVYQQKDVLEKVSELNKKYELQKIDALF